MTNKTVQARLPKRLYEELRRKIEDGYYSSESEVIRDSLRKMFAEESRKKLRNIIEEEEITEEELLNEWKKLREE